MTDTPLIERLTSLAQVATIDLARSVENSGPYTAGNPQDIILDAIAALEAQQKEIDILKSENEAHKFLFGQSTEQIL
ncbi:MAG: hypothetical protein GY749_22955 [Desulfobacteraceae bacterium]|nr:hypothetical protein [Desulfobacteraceae bacterium]